MAGGSTEPDHALEVAYHDRAQLRPVLRLCGPPVAYVLAWLFLDLPGWLALAGIGFFALVLVVGIGLGVSGSIRPTWC